MTFPSIYEPQEDSFLLQEQVIKYCELLKPEVVIDVGTGSGVQAITASKYAKTVFALDIDQASLDFAQEEFKKLVLTKGHENNIYFIRSDLFAKIPEQFLGKADLIIFNAPYLPQEEDDYDHQALFGGKTGVELTEKFLIQAKEFLSQKGIVLFVASSFGDLKKLEKEMKHAGYKFKVISKKHISFEDILIYEAKL